MTENERLVPGPVRSAAQFVEAMRQLKVWVGNPSYHDLESNARKLDLKLASNTLHDALARNRLPDRDVVVAFVRACGAGPHAVEQWAAAWNEIAENERRSPSPEQFETRFESAALQLEDQSTSARLAGVHAMALLGDEWEDGRQLCIDALCACARKANSGLTVDLGGERASPIRTRLGTVYPTASGFSFDDIMDAFFPAQPTAYSPARPTTPESTTTVDEAGVSRAVLRSVAGRLRERAASSWQGYSFDLAGIFLHGGSLPDLTIADGTTIIFDRAVFVSGTMDFQRLLLKKGTLSLASALFMGGTTSFSNLRMTGGLLDLRKTRVAGGSVDFAGAHIEDGCIDLRGTRITGGSVGFGGINITGGRLDLGETHIERGLVDFTDAQFGGGTVSLAGMRLDPQSRERRPPKHTDNTRGGLHFDGASFAAGVVDLRRLYLWELDEYELRQESKQHEWEVGFRGAEFIGGRVDFSGVRLGQRIDLSTVACWRIPATLDSPVNKKIRLPGGTSEIRD